MTKILAIVAFILALIFYWCSVSKFPFTWEFFMLWGFVLDTLSDHPRAP